MTPLLDHFTTFLRSKQRTLASLIAFVLVFNGLFAVSRALDPSTDVDLAGNPSLTSEQLPEGAVQNADGSITLSDGTVISAEAAQNPDVIRNRARRAAQNTRKNVKPDTGKITGKLPTGVTEDEIKVVYYWKGERTMTSPFLGGTDQEGQNLDEGIAFKRFIEFINKHSGDGTEFMGIPIDLHGRKLVGEVIEAGNGDFSYAQAAEKIAEEIRPFAAISSHGSLSAYICPRLAEEGIFNMSTYDLGGLHPVTGEQTTLQGRSNGYCLPGGLTWERQVDMTLAYLKKHKNTDYTAQALPQKRVYGVIYATYPGLKDVGPAMIQRLKDAGIPIAATYKLPPDLANSQTHAPTAVGVMRDAGVNTIIMPDAGAPLNFTHASQANGYDPDYYVWPCSGQDTAGMVRLFNAAQWEGARGLTCYDREFNPDLFADDRAKQAEWYKQYQEISGTQKEAPAPGGLVYSGLFQLVAGLTHAGPDLTPSTFKAGLDKVKRYRYDTIDGRTTDPTNMLITISDPDRAWVGDVAKLRWDATVREEGSSTQGAYVYTEQRRYVNASQL